MPFFRELLKKFCSKDRPEKLLEEQRKEVDFIKQSVHIIHCGNESADERNKVTGLPKEWESVWDLVKNERTSERTRKNIYKKMNKFPKPTMRKEMIIFQGGGKTPLDREVTLQTLEQISAEGDPEEKYDILHRIGGGAYGDVYYAKDKLTDEEVALKQCNPIFVDSAHYFYLNEMIALRIFAHANVIRCFASYYAVPLEAKVYTHFKSTKVPFLIMELMDGSLGELLDFVYKHQQLEEDVILFVMREIFTGVSYLHKKGLFHRDLKSDNILLSTTGEVKLADFGLSTRFAYPDEEFREVLGTTLWMAPEVCRIDKASTSDSRVRFAKPPYTHRADIWSLGVVLIELLDGGPPHLDLYRAKKVSQIKANIIYDPACRPTRKVSAEMDTLLDTMLCKNPADRWNCSRILKLDIFNSAAKPEEFARLVQWMVESV